MAKIPKKVLKWREKQKRGAIMKPSTFESIKEGAAKKYGSEERGKEAAGAAYYKTLMAKYHESHCDAEPL